MKNVFIMILLSLSISFSAFSQEWSYKQPSTRIGVVGNIWHPIGVIFNQDVADWAGVYVTAKSNFERTQVPVMNQFNFTAGVSFKIFTNTSKSNTSDILLGVSYNTDPKNMAYAVDDYNWGGEILLMFPFTDRNFRLIGGWSSNSVRWAEGVTLGFAYQF